MPLTFRQVSSYAKLPRHDLVSHFLRIHNAFHKCPPKNLSRHIIVFLVNLVNLFDKID